MIPQYTIKIRCAWCRVDMGTKPAFAPHDDAEVSHGICHACRLKMDAELKRRKAKMEAENEA